MKTIKKGTAQTNNAQNYVSNTKTAKHPEKIQDA